MKQEKTEERIEEKKLLTRSFLCDVINVQKSRLNKRTKITRTEHVVRHGRKFIMGRDGAPYKAEAKQALSISCCLQYDVASVYVCVCRGVCQGVCLAVCLSVCR